MAAGAFDETRFPPGETGREHRWKNATRQGRRARGLTMAPGAVPRLARRDSVRLAPEERGNVEVVAPDGVVAFGPGVGRAASPGRSACHRRRPGAPRQVHDLSGRGCGVFALGEAGRDDRDAHLVAEAR